MNRNAAIFLLAVSATLSHAAEDFANVPALFTSGGWAKSNLSNPIGGTSPWGQGDSSQFAAFGGAADSYIAANYTAVDDLGTISAWLFAPTTTFNNGDRVTFVTRTGAFPGAPDPSFADRLQVRLSVSGASTAVGADETTVGDFATLLADINPSLAPQGYPDDWMVYDITLSGLAGPTSGRIGFRYFVTDAGASGTNGSLVALDSFTVTPVPEPATMAVLGLGLAAIARRRKAAR